MNKEHIQALLETICQYNNVRITQTFAKDDIDWILVKCVPHTETLELTYLQTESVECYKSIQQAVEIMVHHHKSWLTLEQLNYVNK